ncbi:hypothetical protein JCM5296_003761 [Sporobolomyces johnsonii]
MVGVLDRAPTSPLCWCCCSCELCLGPLPSTSSSAIPSPTSSTAPTLPLPPAPLPSDPDLAAPSSRRKKPKNRRPPPAPLADGSPAPPPPKKPTLPQDGSVKTCEALDRYDERCDDVVVGGWKGKVRRLWCQVHEEEEKSVRASFWNAVSSLPRLSRSSPLPSPSAITTSQSFTELEAWEQIARQHIELAKRAYEAWEYHREHFGASGQDLVDRLEGRGEADGGGDLARGAWEEVRLRGEKAEAVLKLIIRRSHFLVCDAEDALWLLHTDGCPRDSYTGCGYGTPATSDDDGSDDDGCSCCSHRSHSTYSHSHSHGPHSHHHRSDDEKAPHNPLRPPGSPTLAPEAEEPDPLSALETLRRTELLELLSLTGSHASFIREGRKSVERVRIVECLFRRLISRDEELLVKAYRGGHDHVLRFFEDPALVTLPALSRLHHALQRTSPTELKEAIMDAFRAIAWEESGATETEEGEEGVGMQVLGGWVYKNQLERSMTPREWGHLYDLCACPGCATRCCMRFTDLTLIRRLTVIPHGPHPPPFELWADHDESDAQKILKALDIVWCEGKEADDEGKPRRMRLGPGKGKEVWAIQEERNWAFLKLSLTHPHALSILTLLSQYFTLLVRSRLTPLHPLPSFPLPAPNLLWTNRVRHSPTKAGLFRPPPPPVLYHSSAPPSVSTLASTPSPWRAYPNAFNCVVPSSATLAAELLSGFDTLDSPEKEQDLAAFDEVYELLVLDAPGDSEFAHVDRYLARPLDAFEIFLAGVVCQACGLRMPSPPEPEAAEAESRAGGRDKKVGTGGGGGGGEGADSRRILSELKQAALEHGAVESFLRGDLVWDFGDVRGVTTKASGGGGSSAAAAGKGGKNGSSSAAAASSFSGVDLKKVGKDGIVAPPLPAAYSSHHGGTLASSALSAAAAAKKGPANGGGAAGAKGVLTAKANGAVGRTDSRERKEKVLDGLRDDKLALRLARSLFK